MKVELNLEEGYCKVTKEDGDKYISTSGYSRQKETTLLYRIKKELIKQGYDMIQKRMWRDGHMVDDHQNYIRTRCSIDDDNWFGIYNGSWQIFDAGERYNQDGEITLAVHQ